MRLRFIDSCAQWLEHRRSYELSYCLKWKRTLHCEHATVILRYVANEKFTSYYFTVWHAWACDTVIMYRFFSSVSLRTYKECASHLTYCVIYSSTWHNHCVLILSPCFVAYNECHLISLICDMREYVTLCSCNAATAQKALTEMKGAVVSHKSTALAAEVRSCTAVHEQSSLQNSLLEVCACNDKQLCGIMCRGSRGLETLWSARCFPCFVHIRCTREFCPRGI